MSAAVIEVRGLTVGGGAVRRPVSFTVTAGRIHALAGRQGSGRTTVLEVVAGLRRPVTGSVRVRGVDPYGREPSVRTGAVWRDGGLFPGLTVTEVVETWRRWTLDPVTGAEALRLAGLSDRAQTRFEQLSRAEARRLDLALALVSRSDVLLLDEPTADLAEADAREIWATLRGLAQRGVTVLVSTDDPAVLRRADACTRLDRIASSVGPVRSRAA